MGSFVRGGDRFEYEYLGDASLCELAFASKAGRCEIFPELCFVDADAEDNDLIFYLNGENDCIPVDNQEHPFDVFKEFFFSTQKYFDNADIGSLLDMLDESTGVTDKLTLLKKMTEAETVYLSAQCYFTLQSHERPRLLDWINTRLSDETRLTIDDLNDEARCAAAISALEQLAGDEEDGDERPLLALMILIGGIAEEAISFVVHDEDVAWETPLLLDGEVVGPKTAIGEFDTPIF